MTSAVADRFAPPPYSQEAFMDCFIATLVLGNKTEIWIRGRESMLDERRRMYRLNRFLHLVYLQSKRDIPNDRDWMHFILRMRNHTAPSAIGSFEGFIDMLRNKLFTWTSQSPPFFEYYKLEMSSVSAECILRQANPLMRSLGSRAGKIYLKKFKRCRLYD